MSSIEIGLWSFPVLILLIFLRVPIGAAMLGTGIVGTFLVLGKWTPVLAQMKVLAWNTNANYSLSIIPLFLLMGQFAARGGMSQALFNAAAAFLGHRKGGVAMAAIGASAGFGSICGSSLATAATMAQVALPELKRNGYAGGLATASLAAGGTLGILIPPSVVLVIYAILAEQNIAKLFLAAFVPGIIAAISYLIVIAIYVRLKPESAGHAARIPWKDRVPALIAVWPVAAIFFAVVGGIYLGWFTPTQAAAIGAAGAGIVAFVNGGLDRKSLFDCFKETAVSTGMIFFIILGASVFNSFLALVPPAAGGRGMGDRAGLCADDGADHHPGALHHLRLHHGLAVDDRAHHPDLLPDRDGDGFRHEPGAFRHLVRHPGADGGRDRDDNTTGGAQPLHHIGDGPRRADPRDL